jgi:hypothetical protein
VRTLFVGALALTLIGCSRQPSPLATETSCDNANGACVEQGAAGPPTQLASFSPPSPARAGPEHANLSPKRASREKPSHEAKTVRSSRDQAHAKVHLAKRHVAKKKVHLAKNLAKKRVTPALSRGPAPPPPQLPAPSPAPKPPPASVSVAAKTADKAADPPRPSLADARADASGAKPEARTTEQLVAAATAAADRMMAKATAQPANGAGRANARPDNPDLLVAVLMARPDINSVSDLSRKTIALDDRYSTASGNVRTAIVAAGAPEVEVSEEQTAAITRLTKGEVPAAVVALVSPDAAEMFPEIAGFRIFRVPLSPDSVKTRP